MTRFPLRGFLTALCTMFVLSAPAFAAPHPVAKGSSYLGILPSILAEPEPYDYLDALEINLLPLVYEYRPLDRLGIQARPIANLRLISGQAPALSHVGGAVALPWYWDTPLALAHGVSLITGPFSAYTANVQDGTMTLTMGAELGAALHVDPEFALSMTVQPGVNWYPRPLHGTHAFLPHFGVIIHFGWVMP